MSTAAESSQRVVIAVVGAERREWLFAPPGASTASARGIVAGVLATMHVDLDLGRRFARLVHELTRAGCFPCVVATARFRHTGDHVERGWRLVGPADPPHRPDAIALRWTAGRQYFAVPARCTWRSALAAFREAAAAHVEELGRLYGEEGGGRGDRAERVRAIYAARGFPTLRAVTVRCGPLGFDDGEAVDV